MGGVAVDVDQSGTKPPDGGWGWAVLVGCFFITGFSYAFPKAVSVFYKDMMTEFKVGYSDATWISSILLAMLYGTGPLSSVLVNRYGCRPVMMVGGFFASLGMILSSFASNMIYIYLTTGVITGLGLALNFQPSLIMLNSYFSKRRPLANGLSAAGSPVVLSCLSPIGQMLEEQYGWRGGFLVLGGVLMNCCVCAALMKPLPEIKKPQVGRTGTLREMKQEKPKHKLLDFTVVRHRGFIIYTVAASIMVLGLFVPPMLVVSYSKELGNDSIKSALLLTILGVVDIFARPTCGVVAGLKWVRPRCVYFFSIAMILNGITDMVGSQANDYSTLVIYCIFFGLTYGMVGALQFEVLMEIVGREKFSSAIGLVLLVEAMAVLVGPPMAGLLLDASKNYDYVFLLAGGEVVLAAVVLATGNFLCLRKKKKASASLDKQEQGEAKASGGCMEGEEAEPEEEEEEEQEGDVGQEAAGLGGAVGDGGDGPEELRSQSPALDLQEVELSLSEPQGSPGESSV